MDMNEARDAAERFRKAIMSIETSRWCSDNRRITASIGCAVSRPGADTPSTMLKRADFALYAAKRNGRNCVETEPASPRITRRAWARLQRKLNDLTQQDAPRQGGTVAVGAGDGVVGQPDRWANVSPARLVSSTR